MVIQVKNWIFRHQTTWSQTKCNDKHLWNEWQQLLDSYYPIICAPQKTWLSEFRQIGSWRIRSRKVTFPSEKDEASKKQYRKYSQSDTNDSIPGIPGQYSHVPQQQRLARPIYSNLPYHAHPQGSRNKQPIIILHANDLRLACNSQIYLWIFLNDFICFWASPRQPSAATSYILTLKWKRFFIHAEFS